MKGEEDRPKRPKEEDPPLPTGPDARLTPEPGLTGAILEAWDGLIYVGTPDLRIRFMNRRFIDLLGRDATGEHCFRALHGREDPCPWCPREVFQGKTVRGRFQKPANGRWYDVLNSPLPLPDGTLGKVAFIRECSEPEPMARELPAFQHLVDRLSDAVFLLDPADGRFLYANDMACRTLDYRREELLAMRPWDFCEGIPAPPAWLEMVTRIEREGSGILETRHRRRDGSFLEVEVKATSAKGGLQAFIIFVVRDITERRRLERSREDVFSTVSHEMRTPLTAILGFSEYLLENEAAPETQREFLQLMVSQGERLNDLIDNLLSLQRLQAGLGLEDPCPVRIPPLLQEVAESFRTPLVRQAIEIECSADLPPILGETKQIQHAVKNLLGNAAKYSPPHSRIVLGAQTDGDHALLWVRDEGPGIPTEEQEKIFDRFYRVGGRKSTAGTGLGLALVREVADAHGGRTWVESAPGQGSTFFLRLPLAGQD